MVQQAVVCGAGVHFEVPVWVSDGQILIQFPSKAPVKAAEADPNARVPNMHVGDQDGVLVLGFTWPRSGCCGIYVASQ